MQSVWELAGASHGPFTAKPSSHHVHSTVRVTWPTLSNPFCWCRTRAQAHRDYLFSAVHSMMQRKMHKSCLLRTRILAIPKGQCIWTLNYFVGATEIRVSYTHKIVYGTQDTRHKTKQGGLRNILGFCAAFSLTWDSLNTAAHSCYIGFSPIK